MNTEKYLSAVGNRFDAISTFVCTKQAGPDPYPNPYFEVVKIGSITWFVAGCRRIKHTQGMLSSSFDSSHDDEGNEKLTELSYEDFDDISVGGSKNVVSRPQKSNLSTKMSKQKRLDSSDSSISYSAEKLPNDITNNRAKLSTMTNNTADNDDIGFVPSSFDPSKQNRQRRQIGGMSDISNNNNLDELDKVLGFGATKSATSMRSNTRVMSSKAMTSDSSDDDQPPVKASLLQKKVELSSSNVEDSFDNDYVLKPAMKGTTSSTRAGLNVKLDVPGENTNSISNNNSSNNPAWLSGNASPSAGSGRVSPGADYEKIVKVLQNKLEESVLEREALDRNYKLELDTLKRKLNNSNSAFPDSGQIKQYEEGSAKLLRDITDLRRTVSQLEVENSRLRDEATTASVKSHEEIKFLKEKYNNDVSSVEKRYHDDIVLIDKRHTDAVTLLKKMHSEEIEAIKNRSKDNNVLETLTSQISNASGSIKLIEESLHARYRGLDVVREGQLEARERLLSDMEEKARERVNASEIEAFKLKGILSHMEQVISGLRSSTVEDKERLKQEGQRLSNLQISLDNERNAFNNRMTEESSALSAKSKNIDSEWRRLEEDKRKFNDYVSETKRGLENDRQEFVNYLSISTKNADATALRLKEEEEKLSRIRDELYREKAILEQKRIVASADILEAEKLKTVINRHKDDIVKEKNILQRTAHDLHVASEDISKREMMLEEQERMLASREIALRDGMAQMKTAAIALSTRENAITNTLKKIEEKKLEMNKEDADIMQKRLMIAIAQREVLSIPGMTLPQSFPQHDATKTAATPGAAEYKNLEEPVSWTESFQKRLNNPKNNSASTKYNYGQLTGTDNTELNSARKLLEDVKLSTALFSSTSNSKYPPQLSDELRKKISANYSL